MNTQEIEQEQEESAQEWAVMGGGEFFLTISDLMSALLLLVSALLIVYLVNISRKQTELDRSQQRLNQFKNNLDLLLKQRSLIIHRLDLLKKQLQQLQIEVDVIPETGDILIKDEGIFFKSGQATLQPKGQKFLEKFGKAYINLILSPTFRDSIKRLVIIGHASREGEERFNMQLSLRRAESVAYTLQQISFSNQTTDTETLRLLLRQKLLVSGRGIADAHGTQETDRTVRFQIQFRGDALEIQKLFEAHGLAKTLHRTP